MAGEQAPRLSKTQLGNQTALSNDSGGNSSNGTNYEDSGANQAALEEYWLNQRDLFFNLTTFNLSRATNELVGAEYGHRSYHLPFWFDYDMFKNLTERAHPDGEAALKRHHIYVENCVSIWKNSALKRLHRPNNFTFIDHAEDWVSVWLANKPCKM